MTGRLEKRASVYTLGCRLNQAESALMAERLAAAGYAVVPWGEPADLGVVNTCTVTAEADTKSRKAIRAFLRANPEALVAVVGCYSQLQAEVLRGIRGVDLVVGTARKLDFLEFLPPEKRTSAIVVREALPCEDFIIDTKGAVTPGHRANLKIQEGCDCFCSYCVVPLARGRPRSRDLGDLLEEGRRLAAAGAREIVLTGVNVGAYRHGASGLLDVVDGLDAIARLARVRISSIELKTIPEGLLERMAAPAHKLVPFLHIPLQSGCDATLARMRRNYTASEYRRFMERAVAVVPDLCLGADVLVGTPGESQAEFEATCAFVKDSPLAYTHVFKYSERPGTAAQRMADKVAAGEMSARSARMRTIGETKWRIFRERFLGRQMEVLFEQREAGVWCGYTGNYIRVGVCCDLGLVDCVKTTVLERLEGEIMRGQLV